MANDIKQKIVLEGEKEYNRALSDAKRNLKTLRSELKAETAELGANATAQQKNETRIKSLQKQIKEQEKIVKTYQEALKEVKEKYSDNEEAISKWEIKLNDARTSLANMKNELEGVGQDFKSIENSASMATVASKSVADSFEKLSEVGGLISDGIESAFTGLLTTAKDVISQIWEGVVDLAARSNNLVDLAGFWNTDVTTIQKYAGAVREVSGDLTDLNSLVTKINAGDSKKITELVGVSKENYKDDWEYAMSVMDSLSKMSHENRNNAALQIFGGKQANKAYDLLNDWEKLLAHLDKYDAENGGYGLTEVELKKMSDLYDMVNGLKTSWQYLQDMATVKLFGDLAIDLTGNAQAILDAFLEYFNAKSDGERDAAIKKIEDNITQMFTRVKEAIEKGIEMIDKIAEDLKASENPTAQALGQILSGLVDALKWLTEDNMKNVVSALEILAAFWLTGNGLKMAAKIAAVVKDIAAIKAYNATGGATGAVTGATAGAGGGGWLKTLVAGLLKAVPWLAGGYVLLNPSATSDKVGNNELVDKNGNLTEEAKQYGYQLDKNGDLEWTPEQEKIMMRKIWENQVKYGTASVAMTEAQWQAVQKFWDIYRENPSDFDDKYYEEYENAFKGQEELFSKVEEMMDYFVQAEHPYDWQTFEDLPASWWQTQGGNSGNTDGMTSADAKSMTDAVNKMPNAVANSVSRITVQMDGAVVGHLVAPYVSREIAMGIS